MTRDEITAHLALHGWQPTIAYGVADAPRGAVIISVCGPGIEIWKGYKDGLWRVDAEHDYDPTDTAGTWDQFTNRELRTIVQLIEREAKGDMAFDREAQTYADTQDDT